MYTLYILHCSDESYYTGVTRHFRLRMRQHAEAAVVYTSTRLPVTIAYLEQFRTQDAAILREKQIKGWTRRKKEALFTGQSEKLKSLAKKVFKHGK